MQCHFGHAAGVRLRTRPRLRCPWLPDLPVRHANGAEVAEAQAGLVWRHCAGLSAGLRVRPCISLPRQSPLAVQHASRVIDRLGEVAREPGDEKDKTWR